MNERRTVKKVIRYTADEAGRLRARAHECGRPVACYVREVSLGASPRARHGHADAELVRVLAGIGNSLVELSRHPVVDVTPSRDRLNTVLDELLEAIRRIE